MSDKPFDEQLYAKLSTIFGKTIGQNLDIRQIDAINYQVRELAIIMAEFVDKRAELKALQIVKKLNEATGKGFEIVDEKLEIIEHRITDLETEDWSVIEEAEPRSNVKTPSPYDASVDRYSKKR